MLICDMVLWCAGKLKSGPNLEQLQQIWQPIYKVMINYVKLIHWITHSYFLCCIYIFYPSKFLLILYPMFNFANDKFMVYIINHRKYLKSTPNRVHVMFFDTWW